MIYNRGVETHITFSGGMTIESRNTYIYNSHQKCFDHKLNPNDLPAPQVKLPKSVLEQKKRVLDEIIIGDDGFGMDKDTLEKLSTPFYSTKKYGWGLGLSMSYSMIELHKGRIKAGSENGKGTAFIIWLPQT
ncbi:ATP-binding protein [Paenibacillus glycanilyticus]|uniref:ATP-binding protein n=1 Tax=Paenibacillus glycanilyticus TaxID=126569 RepID=UPI00203F45A6|nr:ATP-binding protein [Paenibacillus glycanilyticus]MCM3627692.1 ATP-binding protein [Paenibacillus glycanilyticus]